MSSAIAPVGKFWLESGSWGFANVLTNKGGLSFYHLTNIPNASNN